MYFKEFDKIFYDFKNRSGDSTLRALTDITTNVRIKKEAFENITLFDEYDLKEGETPEIVAEKYYGNPELHWVIMLVNQRYDYINDFPLSTEELHSYVISTYGAENVDQIHHYEKDGLITQANGKLKVNSTIYEQAEVNDIITNDNVFARVTDKATDATGSWVFIMAEKGNFKVGELLTLAGVRINDRTRKPEYQILDNFSITPSAFQLSPGFVAITNMAYEEIQNEKKRRIKLISPNLINQIVKEFRDLV